MAVVHDGLHLELPDELPLTPSSPDDVPLDDDVRLHMPGVSPEELPLSPSDLPDIAPQALPPPLASLALVNFQSIALLPAPGPAPPTAAKRRGRPSNAARLSLVGYVPLLFDSVSSAALSLQLHPGVAPETSQDTVIAQWSYGLKSASHESLYNAARFRGGALASTPTSSPFAATPHVAPALAACVELANRTQAPMDDAIGKVAHFLTSGKESLLVSVEALAAFCKIERKTFPRMLSRIAYSLSSLLRYRIAQVDDALLTRLPRSSLLQHVEFAQHDETPMATRTKGDAEQMHQLAQLRPADRSASSELVPAPKPNSQLCRLGASKALSLSATQEQQKIIQTQLGVGYLVLLSGRHVCITFSPIPSPLSCVERCTSASIKAQQLSVSHTTRASLAFKGRTRAVTTDGFSANPVAENSIASDRNGGVSNRLHVICDTHGVAGVYGKVFKPLDRHITGVIRTAMSLRNGAAMARWRKCLRLEVVDRLELLDGSPPREATEYKKFILRLFVSHGACLLMRRILLILCPNGEWRHHRVQFYIGFGSPFANLPRSEVVDHVTNGLLLALASTQPPIYNRSKWTGSDIAVDSLSIVEAVHRLLSTTYCRFVASYLKGSMVGFYLELRLLLCHYDPTQLAVQDAAPVEADDPEDELEGEVGGVADGAPQRNNGEAQSARDESIGAAKNAKDRRLAMECLRSTPLGDWILMRLLMEPLRHYLSMQFERAANAWDDTEIGKMAEAINSGSQYRRKLRIVEAAKGADDIEFFRKVACMLHSEDLWKVMPPSRHTVGYRAKAFRSISRLGCAFWYLGVGPSYYPHSPAPRSLPKP
jgi:hypothetical protein